MKMVLLSYIIKIKKHNIKEILKIQIKIIINQNNINLFKNHNLLKIKYIV